jgi:hypothetical protein
VTLIQRFGSALNLNIHFHALVLDGAYLVGTEPPVFRRIEPPRQEELQALVSSASPNASAERWSGKASWLAMPRVAISSSPPTLAAPSTI